MRHPLKQLGRLAVALVLGSVAANAQETGFDAQFKLRAGVTVGTVKDNLDSRVMGMGLDLGYKFSFGRLGLELGYQYKPGSQFGVDPTTQPLASGTIVVNPAYSADLRRNELSGVTARLGYEREFAGSDFMIRGGIQLGGAKFRQEYVGQVANANPLAAAPPATTWADTYNGVLTKSVIAVSPFVGVGYKLTDASKLELNLVFLGYKAVNYQHVAGQAVGTAAPQIGGHTGQDYVVENNRSIPHLELGYSFRF